MEHRARKRFGQNFLRDQGVIQGIVAAIRPREGEHLVEIGPGMGAVQHVDQNRVDAKCGLVQPVNRHIRGWISQLASALFAGDHRPVDPVPVAQHSGGFSWIPCRQRGTDRR